MPRYAKLFPCRLEITCPRMIIFFIRSPLFSSHVAIESSAFPSFSTFPTSALSCILNPLFPLQFLPFLMHALFFGLARLGLVSSPLISADIRIPFRLVHAFGYPSLVSRQGFSSSLYTFRKLCLPCRRTFCQGSLMTLP